MIWPLIVTLLVILISFDSANAFFQSLFKNSGSILNPNGGAASLTRGGNSEILKRKILDLARTVNRGLTESEDERNEMLHLFEKLEKMSKNDEPLKSSLVNDVWQLEYTTSDSILGRNDFPRVGPILQTIDTTNLFAENSETVSYFGVRVPRKVTAELSPVNSRLTDVQFKRFQIGPFVFKAPSSFKGSLEVTYLDKDVR